MWRMLKSVAAVAVAWAVATHLEDLARWLRIREMSNPYRYPPSDRSPGA